jgi:hypothetical protein
MFAGAPLSPGVHYLIVERTPVRSITVRQPSGSDTSVVVKLPEDWTHGASVQAIDRNDALIADVTTSVAGMQTTFPCARTVSGTPVEYYRISQAKPTRRRE